MKIIVIALGLVAALMLSGCATIPDQEAADLKATIDQAEAPKFGTIVTESHKAAELLDRARQIFYELQGQTGGTQSALYREGTVAAQRALVHRRTAEAALNAILQPMCAELNEHEKRIQSLERRHHLRHSTVKTLPVYFDFGSAEIRPAEEGKFNLIAASLKGQGRTDVRLIGLTDTVGTAKGNKDLARSRTEAVKSALAAHKVSTKHTRVESRGEAGGPNNVKNAHNRRVEIQIHGLPSAGCHIAP
jgi:outer membrane protein OmpA-like peptidoglycan-associated protein